MREIGQVTALNGNRATVKVDKKDECSKCGMCLFPKNAQAIEFTANNEIKAGVGDTVQLEMHERGKLLGAILVFFVPLLLIGLSALITFTAIGKEIFMLVISIPSIVVWYVILALIDKKLKRTIYFSHKIISIIKKAEENIIN